MEQSSHLSLPYLQPQQSQKHVTVNEGLRKLDAIVQLSVLSATTAEEPAEPADGDRYIVPPSAAGEAWGSMATGAIACYVDGAWSQVGPREGWLCWIADEEALAVFNNDDWEAVSAGGGGEVPDPLEVGRFGVNTAPDSVNFFAVKSDAALFHHDDVTPGAGDMRIVCNKASASDTASFLFQTDDDGRAEFGLVGDDDFQVKVSADGESFTSALVIDKDDGKVAFPQGLAAPLPVADGGTGAATALAALSSLGFRIALDTIADDNAAVVDFGASVNGAAILAVPNSLTTGPCAFFYIRLSTSPDITTLFAEGHSFTTSTGPLTGTTGADGGINFSAGDDGKLYIENRRGFNANYTLYVFLR